MELPFSCVDVIAIILDTILIDFGILNPNIQSLSDVAFLRYYKPNFGKACILPIADVSV